MKKSTKIFITSLAICTSLGALVAAAKVSQVVSNALFRSRPSNMDCSYYFDSTNGFTPITTINYDLFANSKKSSYKSWGTVTEQWVNSGKTNTYVQSTDKYGNMAAICLYGCNTPASSYPIGSVVEFEFNGSSLTSYNNLPEITSLTSITKVYDRNPCPVESYNAEEFWSDGYSGESQYFETAKQYGPVRIRLEHVHIANLPGDNKNATVTTGDYSYTVPLYFANVGDSGTTSNYINAALTNLSNSGAFTIYGYLNTFKTTSLQFLLRNTFDIVPSSFTRDSDIVESVSVPSDMKLNYQVGDTFNENRLTLNMRDGSQKQANTVEYAGYDMNTAGEYNLNANYTYYAGTNNQLAGNTVREFVTINVTGSSSGDVTPELLEVWGSYKTEYNVGDEFEIPTYVYVDYSDGSWANVALECTYTGYNLNLPGAYTVLVSYTYNGVTVTDTYTITVSGSSAKEPSYIQVLYATTEYNVGDTFDTPSVALYYTDGSTKNISYDCLYEGYDLNTPGTYTVEVTYFEGDFVDYTTYTITVSGTAPQDNTITFSSAITSGSYSTGNYGNKSSNGYEFTYYRTTSYSGYVANLLPAVCDYGDPMGGSIANVDPIKGMTSVKITYSNTSKSGATAGKLSYGQNNTLDGSLSIPYSTSTNTVTLNLPDNTNYIKIECGNTKLALQQFVVSYTNSGSDYNYTPISAYTSNYRVNPNKYTGTLVAGSTNVTVPVSVSFSGNKYTVLQSKTYTYYTLDYVESHSSVINDAAMTDPVDVANYYSIFGEIPANYGGSSSGMNSVSDVKNVFGNSLTRQVSYYSRTDGYATAVPNINASQGYYEFDIDLDGSYTTSSGGRGVGRVVAWKYGINNSAYGNGAYRVCHFTDDHYATFQEFNNLGSFLAKFDAERKITGKKWSAPNTATAA